MDALEQKFYRVIVRGTIRMDNGVQVLKADGKTPEMDYIREAITPAEFSKDGKTERRRKYVICELPENAKTKMVAPDGTEVEVSTPDTKPYVFNIFEDQYPGAYRAIAGKILAGQHTPILGDSSGKTTLINGYNILGRVVPFIIQPVKEGDEPISFYMTTIDDKGKTVKYSTKKRNRDGQIVEIFPTTISGKVFLYGDECANPDVFIGIARKKLLDTAERVKPITNQVGGAGTVENSIIIENETAEEPEGTTNNTPAPAPGEPKTT